MPEEVKETAPQPEQTAQPEQAAKPEETAAAGQTPVEETSQPAEADPFKNEKRMTAALSVLLVLLCVFELGMFSFIGLNIYRNVRTNRAIAERNAAIAQDRAAAGQSKIQYSGPGRRIVDGVLVSEQSSGTTGGSVRYVLNTDTRIFHTPSCSEVAAISPEDYDSSSDSRETVISQGYTACEYCNP